MDDDFNNEVGAVLGPEILLPMGWVKLDKKFAFCSPTAGRRTQFFQLIFTQPMGNNISGSSTA